MPPRLHYKISPELQRYYQDYITYLQDTARPTTVSSHSSRLRPYLAYLTKTGVRLGDTNPQTVYSFLATMEKRWSKSTREQAKSMLMSFYSYLFDVGVLPVNPLRGRLKIKEVVSGEREFSEEELRAITSFLRVPSNFRNLPVAYRDDYSVLVLVLMDTGLRLSAALSLTVDQVDLDRGYITFSDWDASSKGKPRKALIGPRTVEALFNLIKLREDQFKAIGKRWDGRVFSVSRVSVIRLFEGMSKCLGFCVHAHRFRHTWATRMARVIPSQPLLKELGGWRSDRIVARYVHGVLDGYEEEIRRKFLKT